jgi:hypothetical protein
MFGIREKHLKKRCVHLETRVTDLMVERDELEDKVHTIGGEFKKLKLTKKIEEEEVQHKLKMREEEVDLKYEKRAHEIEKEGSKFVADNKADCLKEIGEVKDKYRDKVEKTLEKRSDELRSMYTEILARLPDVSVNVGGTTVKSKKSK